MSIDYCNLIRETEENLLELEKKHRSTHLSHRLRMLRLLKSGTSKSIQQAADVVGYSWRQCQRWITTYRKEGLSALLIDRTHERGNHEERVTPEAWASLEEAMQRGEIDTYERARKFLTEHGIHYKDQSSIFRLFERHQVKAKTGRYRHKRADPEEQEAFKKTSPPG
jgi:transposase